MQYTLVCLIAVALACWFLLRPAAGMRPTSPIPGLTLGEVAPEVALPDLRGRMVRLSSLRGRWVVLNFWGITCPPCAAEVPAMQRAYAARPPTAANGARPEILGVDGDLDGVPAVRSFIRRAGVGYPVLVDSSLVVMTRYHIGQLPTSVVVDPGGRLRLLHVGPLAQRAIGRALRGEVAG